MAENDKMKKIGEIVWSIGIGGLVSFYFMQFSVANLLPLSKSIDEMIQQEKMNDIGNGPFEIIILFIGIFCLLISPLFLKWDENYGRMILCLLLFGFVDFVGVIVVIARGQMFLLYEIVIWLSFIYLAWFCLCVFKILYRWTKILIKDLIY